MRSIIRNALVLGIIFWLGFLLMGSAIGSVYGFTSTPKLPIVCRSAWCEGRAITMPFEFFWMFTTPESTKAALGCYWIDLGEGIRTQRCPDGSLWPAHPFLAAVIGLFVLCSSLLMWRFADRYWHALLVFSLMVFGLWLGGTMTLIMGLQIMLMLWAKSIPL